MGTKRPRSGESTHQTRRRQHQQQQHVNRIHCRHVTADDSTTKLIKESTSSLQQGTNGKCLPEVDKKNDVHCDKHHILTGENNDAQAIETCVKVHNSFMDIIPQDDKIDRVALFTANSDCIEKDVARRIVKFLEDYAARNAENDPKGIDEIMTGIVPIYRYKMIRTISEGTFGVVYLASNVETGEEVAIKRFKIDFTKDGIPKDDSNFISCMREVHALKRFSHKNIVRMREMASNSDMSGLFLVMDHIEYDLGDLLDVMDSPFPIPQAKRLLIDLVQALHFIHLEGYVHRDIKLANLLVSGEGCLKLCDFGLARKIKPSQGLAQENDLITPLTPVVATLWYRPPELLLGSTTYDSKVDIWGVGCVFITLLIGQHPFKGRGEIDQLRMIFKCFGTPVKSRWPEYFELPTVKAMRFIETPKGGGVADILEEYLDNGTVSESGIELMEHMLELNPHLRASATDILNSRFLKSDGPKVCSHGEVAHFIERRLMSADQESSTEYTLDKLSSVSSETTDFTDQPQSPCGTTASST